MNSGLVTQRSNATPTSNELAAERTDLGVSRTVMAADRSLMAWIRTALSMISFGFTIYKLLESFKEHGGALRTNESPRNMGLFLIGIGTLSMLMGTAEYVFRIKDLRELEKTRYLRPSLIMAVIMSLTGLSLFLSIATRVL
jgi:putative membrane protein